MKILSLEGKSSEKQKKSERFGIYNLCINLKQKTSIFCFAMG